MTQSLPKYFREYLDEKFKLVEIRINEIKRILEEDDGLIKKVERHERWINEITGKITIILIIIGAIFSILIKVFESVLIKIF